MENNNNISFYSGDNKVQLVKDILKKCKWKEWKCEPLKWYRAQATVNIPCVISVAIFQCNIYVQWNLVGFCIYCFFVCFLTDSNTSRLTDVLKQFRDGVYPKYNPEEVRYFIILVLLYIFCQIKMFLFSTLVQYSFYVSLIWIWNLMVEFVFVHYSTIV